MLMAYFFSLADLAFRFGSTKNSAGDLFNA